MGDLRTYTAVVEPEQDGGSYVTVPALPPLQHGGSALACDPNGGQNGLAGGLGPGQ